MAAVPRSARGDFADGVPAAIRAFLPCPTPDAWLRWADDNGEVLLIDHANCEKKAASTAVSMMFRYADRERLAQSMSRLAREELRHFEQVSKIIAARDIAFRRVPASRYATRLLTQAAGHEPQRLRDLLICGAFIEARSCERFAALIPRLDDELAAFYAGLLKSEARHFENYLDFARAACADGFDARVAEFAAVEAAAVCEPDIRFAFHSGPPDATVVSS